MYAIVTSKGRITLPKALRDELSLKPGDRIAFVQNPDGSYTLYPKNIRAATLRGILKDKYNGPPITIEEMNRMVAEEAGRRNR